MTARLLRPRNAVFIGLGCAIAALAACAAPEVARGEAEAKKTTQASSVVVEIRNASGSSIGSCSGTLIGPKTVLTAGHCIAGAASWTVSGTSASSKASLGATPWKNFRSDMAHPDHSDVGILLLDEEIKLDSYPSIAAGAAKDGAKGTRFHREAATSKEAIPTSTFISSGANKGFKLNYLAESEDGEFLDSGGAVLDGNGDIVGVVSGKGKKSALLHIARVDGYAKWLSTGAACSSGAGVRSWGSGSSSSSGGFGSTPAQGGGGWWGSQPWGSSSGGYGGPPNGNHDGGSTVPGYDPNAPAPAPATPGTSGSNTTPEAPATCPGTPACDGTCGSTSTPDGACDGPTCGGCTGTSCADTNVDYGGCASCSGPSPVVR